MLHIELRRWADCLVIAPLSANTLAKCAQGLCDNLLTCVVSAGHSSLFPSDLLLDQDHTLRMHLWMCKMCVDVWQVAFMQLHSDVGIYACHISAAFQHPQEMRSERKQPMYGALDKSKHN